jgi:hypothetical protein
LPRNGEVDDVRGSEEDQRRGDQSPGAVDAPAGGGQGAGDQPQEDQVRAGIGEADRDAQGVAAERIQHRREDQRRGDGGDGERSDQAVDPGERVDPCRAAAQQQDQGEEGRRVEGEEEGVGRRGERGRAGVVEGDRVVGLPEGPEQQPDPEAEPGEPLAGEACGPDEHRRRGAEHDDVVGPAPERVLNRRSADRAEDHRGVGGEEHREGAEPGSNCRGQPAGERLVHAFASAGRLDCLS